MESEPDFCAADRENLATYAGWGAKPVRRQDCSDLAPAFPGSASLSADHWAYRQRPCTHAPLQHCVDELHPMLWNGKQHRWTYGEHQWLQHWAFQPYCVQAVPSGRHDDCAATGRGLKLRKPTVSITKTARFLKIRKRDIAFLLLIIWMLTNLHLPI